MQNQVIAYIEIEDQKIEYYTSVLITQQFNAHHEFVIRVKYDELEKEGFFKLQNAQKLIGKFAIINLALADVPDNTVYEFRGIICEITMEQSENFTSDLVLKGYSPTVLLENGPHMASFYQSDLKKIVKQVTKPLAQNNCNVEMKPVYSKQVNYICQYRESGFHFLNRLSSDFSEWFYYDGKVLHFGKPSKSKEIDVTYGEDVNNLQFTLRLMPMTFSNYSYNSKSDSIINARAPSGVDGLNQYASFALKESNKLFSEPSNSPLRQRAESKSDLEGFVKKQKAALAADLQVLSGNSDNPSLCIGAIANVQIAQADEDSKSSKAEYGKFLITSINHHIGENGKYHNTFEAIPSTLEVVPVKNVIMPIAEPQTASVTDNLDPDNMGRVRVQMLWQKESNQKTDWLRVMTPDAGTSGQFSKNRGMVFVPEVGDQVLVCFRYNDADRPFVLGSIFQGKSGGGGGAANKTKSLATRSGHLIELNDEDGAEKITIKDKNNNFITIDTPKGCILIKDKAGNYFTIDATGNHITAKDKNGNYMAISSSTNSITLKDKNGNNVSIEAGSNSVSITALGSITLAAASINLVAAGAVNIGAGAAFTLNAMTSLSNILSSTMLRTKSLTQMVSNAANISAKTINHTAKQDINSKAKGKMVISAEDKIDQHAGQMDVSTKKGNLRLKSSGEAEIKGTQVKIN